MEHHLGAVAGRRREVLLQQPLGTGGLEVAGSELVREGGSEEDLPDEAEGDQAQHPEEEHETAAGIAEAGEATEAGGGASRWCHRGPLSSSPERFHQ